MPQTAVNIVTYNSAATIGICLDALIAQKGEFSVLVIDNNSTDDTVNIVQRYKNVTLHCNTENVGYAVAHNQGINMTDSEFVLTLNPDVKLLYGFLPEMAKIMAQYPRAGMAAGCLLRVNDLGQFAPDAIDSLGVYMRRNMRQGLFADGKGINHAWNSATRVFGADGAAAFYRREMLDDIAINGEYFDEDFFIHKEDIDICFRAILRGWHGIYSPYARAHHVRHFRPGQSRQTVSDDLRRHAVRNRYYLMLKNLPTPLFWRYLPFILPYDIAIFGYILLKERESLAAFTELRQNWNKMIDKRKQIQSRRVPDLKTLSQWFDASLSPDMKKGGK